MMDKNAFIKYLELNNPKRKENGLLDKIISKLENKKSFKEIEKRIQNSVMRAIDNDEKESKTYITNIDIWSIIQCVRKIYIDFEDDEIICIKILEHFLMNENQIDCTIIKVSKFIRELSLEYKLEITILISQFEEDE